MRLCRFIIRYLDVLFRIRGLIVVEDVEGGLLVLDEFFGCVSLDDPSQGLAMSSGFWCADNLQHTIR